MKNIVNTIQLILLLSIFLLFNTLSVVYAEQIDFSSFNEENISYCPADFDYAGIQPSLFSEEEDENCVVRDCAVLSQNLLLPYVVMSFVNTEHNANNRPSCQYIFEFGTDLPPPFIH